MEPEKKGHSYLINALKKRRTGDANQSVKSKTWQKSMLRVFFSG